MPHTRILSTVSIYPGVAPYFIDEHWAYRGCNVQLLRSPCSEVWLLISLQTNKSRKSLGEEEGFLFSVAASGKVDLRAVFRGAEQWSILKRERSKFRTGNMHSRAVSVTLWSNWSLSATGKLVSLDIMVPASSSPSSWRWKGES